MMWGWAVAVFGQTFSFPDIATIAVLVVLEGVLSIDNALVLGLLAKRVEPGSRMRVLSFGLIGAFIFRLVAVALAAYLLRWSIIKLLGGLYLIYVAVHYFIGRARSHRRGTNLDEPIDGYKGFWATVAAIELTDVAFAIDSILAAVALVGGPPPGTPADAVHPKLWVILTGGMLGVILMRFAAVIFIRLLEKFPRLNTSAYLLVILIGLKLAIDWAANSPTHERVDFQDIGSPAFWIFWISMAVCLGAGLFPVKSKSIPLSDRS